MGRLCKLPDEYTATRPVNYREDCEGGDIHDPTATAWLSAPLPSGELLVLVHGFNNDHFEAASAYLNFRKLQQVLPEVLKWPGAEQLADLFWPGDAAWGLLDWADAAVYPKAVGTAKEVSKLISTHLKALPPHLTVNFLGHSLGCRVILEVIEHLLNGSSTSSAPNIGKVCLMAAAIPDFMLGPEGRLRNALNALSHLGILHSRDDWVLSGPFRPGQFAAGSGEGWWPEAVGLHGSVPGGHAGIVKREIAGAGHSHYWGEDSQSDEGREAARCIRRFFSSGHFPVIRSSGSATVPAHEVGSTRPAIARRPIAQVRSEPGLQTGT